MLSKPYECVTNVGCFCAAGIQMGFYFAVTPSEKSEQALPPSMGEGVITLNGYPVRRNIACPIDLLRTQTF
jgi:hypothetical protein